MKIFLANFQFHFQFNFQLSRLCVQHKLLYFTFAWLILHQKSAVRSNLIFKRGNSLHTNCIKESDLVKLPCQLVSKSKYSANKTETSALEPILYLNICCFCLLSNVTWPSANVTHNLCFSRV